MIVYDVVYRRICDKVYSIKISREQEKYFLMTWKTEDGEEWRKTEKNRGGELFAGCSAEE